MSTFHIPTITTTRATTTTTTPMAPETGTQTETTIPPPPPPPYTPLQNLPSFLTYQTLFPNLEDEDSQEEPQHQTTNITLNAPITIHGHGNVISFPTQEFTKMACWIVAAVQQSTSASKPTSVSTSSASDSAPAPASAPVSISGNENRGNVHVNLNCGITVTGQRNVVGCSVGNGVATRAVRAQAAAANNANAGANVGAGVGVGATRAADSATRLDVPITGSKRKAEEELDDAPVAKRVDGEGDVVSLQLPSQPESRDGGASSSPSSSSSSLSL